MDEAIAQEAENIEDRGLPGKHDPNLRNDILGLWQQATNWYTLTELNRRYLEGRLALCPSYDFPVEPETEFFSRLLELHDYGIISTNSCPGTRPEDGERSQRAFLFFNIPTRGLRATSPYALYSFVQALVASTEVYAHVRFQYYNAPYGIQRDAIIDGLMQRGSYNNLPRIDDDAWRGEGWSYDRDDQGHACTLNFVQAVSLSERGTGIEDSRIQTCGSSFRDDENPISASHRADPLQISVVARDWNYTAIGELIERLLTRSGILPAYSR